MSKVILPPPPPRHRPRRKDALVDKDSNELGPTKWEYQRHLDEIDELVREANANQTIGPVKGGLKPLSEKDRAIFLTWIQSKIRAADPEARQKFCQLVEGVEF
jgi:hypothetical protein